MAVTEQEVISIVVVTIPVHSKNIIKLPIFFPLFMKNGQANVDSNIFISKNGMILRDFKNGWTIPNLPQMNWKNAFKNIVTKSDILAQKSKSIQQKIYERQSSSILP